MLTIITILSITVVLVALTIIAFKRSKDEARTLPKILVLLSSIFGVFLVACSALSITVNVNADKEYDRLVAERAEIVELGKANVAQSQVWDYRVRYFNFFLTDAKNKASNPWSNWFCSPRVLELENINLAEILGEIPIYNFEYSSENELMGTVGGSSSGEYGEGMSITVEAKPNEGYDFVAWYDEDDNPVSWSATYQFNIRQDTTLIASFKAIPDEGFSDFKLEYYVEGPGKISGDRQGRYDENTLISLTATPDEGYEFLGWYDNGVTLLNKNLEYNFSIMAPTNLTAKFGLEEEEPVGEDEELSLVQYYYL